MNQDDSIDNEEHEFGEDDGSINNIEQRRNKNRDGQFKVGNVQVTIL